MDDIQKNIEAAFRNPEMVSSGEVWRYYLKERLRECQALPSFIDDWKGYTNPIEIHMDMSLLVLQINFDPIKYEGSYDMYDLSLDSYGPHMSKVIAVKKILYKGFALPEIVLDSILRRFLNTSLDKNGNQMPLQGYFDLSSWTEDRFIQEYRNTGLKDYRAWAKEAPKHPLFRDLISDDMGLNVSLDDRSWEHLWIFCDVLAGRMMYPRDIPRILKIVNKLKPTLIEHSRGFRSLGDLYGYFEELTIVLPGGDRFCLLYDICGDLEIWYQEGNPIRTEAFLRRSTLSVLNVEKGLEFCSWVGGELTEHLRETFREFPLS